MPWNNLDIVLQLQRLGNKFYKCELEKKKIKLKLRLISQKLSFTQSNIDSFHKRNLKMIKDEKKSSISSFKKLIVKELKVSSFNRNSLNKSSSIEIFPNEISIQGILPLTQIGKFKKI